MKKIIGTLLLIGLLVWLLLSFPFLWYVIVILGVLAIIGWCFND